MNMAAQQILLVVVIALAFTLPCVLLIQMFTKK